MNYSATCSVLIVDGLPDSRRFVKSCLHKKGMENFHMASTFEDAKKLLRDQKDIGLVICSYLIDEHTGVDIYTDLPEKLKSNFLMLYGEEESNLVYHEVKQFNGLRILKKPFSFSDIEKALEKSSSKQSSGGQIQSKKITKDSKILIIDDFEMMRVMMKNAFMELGYLKLDEAENGEEALKKLKLAKDMGEPFDVIFSDWNMPEMDGLELFRVCKSDEAFRNIPFVMVTAENEKSSVIMAITEGVTNYIVKPLTPDTLVEKIKKVNQKLVGA
ncbi:MAG: response regulator [Bacteriovoracaceae bacterium]